MSAVLDARAKAMVAAVELSTGRNVADFAKLAASKGLGGKETKPGPIISWLKEDFGLGHGQAMAIAHAIRNRIE